MFDADVNQTYSRPSRMHSFGHAVSTHPLIGVLLSESEEWNSIRAIRRNEIPSKDFFLDVVRNLKLVEV
jgi:hypothetical protein